MVNVSRKSCCAPSAHLCSIDFPSNMRPHISINVPDVQAVRRFYLALFGEEPVKERNDYIKWELDSPPVNFTLNQHPAELMSREELGIEVDALEKIEPITQRLNKIGVFSVPPANSPVFSTSDDPFGNHWEFMIRDSRSAPLEENDMSDITLWEFAWDLTYPVPDKNIVIKLNVANVTASILFYRNFLDIEPVWQSKDRAVFVGDDPAIKLILVESPNPKACAGHYGFQMKNTYLVEEVHRRLEKLGFKLTNESSIACCYAIQTKVWAADPDGNRWEFFVTTESDTDVGCGSDCICHKSLERTIFPTEEGGKMNNELHKMSTVTQNESGVEVRVQGKVEKNSIEEMVEKCSTGTQSCCGSDFFAKVTSIKVSGQDGDVSIHVNGDDVTKEMIETNLRNCDCYRP